MIHTHASVTLDAAVSTLAVVSRSMPFVLLGTTCGRAILCNLAQRQTASPLPTPARNPAAASIEAVLVDLQLHSGTVTQCTEVICCSSSSSSAEHGQLLVAMATRASGDQLSMVHVLKVQLPCTDEDIGATSGAAMGVAAVTSICSDAAAISMDPSGTNVAVAYHGGRVEVFAIVAVDLAATSASAGLADQDVTVDNSTAEVPTGGVTQQLRLQLVGSITMEEAQMKTELSRQHAVPALHWQLYTAAQPGQSEASTRTPRALFAHDASGATLHRLPLHRERIDSAQTRAAALSVEAPAVPATGKAGSNGHGAPAAGKPVSASKKGGAAPGAAAASAQAAVSAPAKPVEGSERSGMVGKVAMRFPCAIVCSASSQDGSQVLLALQSGSLALYSTRLGCTLATSACLPSAPRALALSCGGESGGWQAALSGSNGVIATWNGTDGILDVIAQSLPFTLVEMQSVGYTQGLGGLGVLAQTACGRLLLVDTLAGTATHELELPGEPRSGGVGGSPAETILDAACPSAHMWTATHSQVRCSTFTKPLQANRCCQTYSQRDV